MARIWVTNASDEVSAGAGRGNANAQVMAMTTAETTPPEKTCETPVSTDIAHFLKQNNLSADSRHHALIMYSGGLDSLVILYNVLMSTNISIHAHHIEIINVEKRAEVENQAIDEQLAFFKANCRPFEYSSSKSEMMLGLGGGLDSTLSLFTAGRVHTALGSRFASIWTGHITPAEWEMTEGAAVLSSLFIYKRVKPIWLRPLRRLRKPQILASVPPKVADLAWTCRRPVLENGIYQRCGVCHACKGRASAEEKLKDSGYGPMREWKKPPSEEKVDTLLTGE